MNVRLLGTMVGTPHGSKGDIVEVSKAQGERMIKARAALPVKDSDVREDKRSRNRQLAQRT